MFRTLAGLVPRDRDLPERAWRIECLRRMLDGSLYDVALYEFHQERQDAGAGEYIPLAKRAPSVRSRLASVVVAESASFLFGEGRFPAIECEDAATRDTLRDVAKDSALPAMMHEAAQIGSVGSVVVFMRVLAGRIYWQAMPTCYLTPTFKADAPDTLGKLAERRKVKGAALRDEGYDVPDADLSATFWFEREWDDAAETWFLPRKVADTKAERAIDTSRTVKHGLGFLPAVWVRNLPGGEGVDGACTFAPGIETIIEIDYQLSQCGRGLKYSADPLLLIREPAAPDGDVIKGGGNALVVSEKGDAKLLEIGGTAASAQIEYVRYLRDVALEACGGFRGSPERMTTATSGRALEMLYHPSLAQADRLRTSYGEGALLRLLGMVRLAQAKLRNLEFRDGRPVPAMQVGQPIMLRWPKWFSPSEEDKQQQAATLSALRAAGLISRETSLRVLASDYDIEDIPAEMARIAADEAAADARLAAQAQAQAKATETLPG